MKRLVFLFISILFITFAFAKTGVYAQDRVVQTDTPLGVEMPATPSSETTPRRVNYELAYPGMLPCSFLLTTVTLTTLKRYT